MLDFVRLLREHGIPPTPQRLAVIRYALGKAGHSTADEAWSRARRDCPTVSRATVYNTLNLLARKGLLRLHRTGGGAMVFDSNLERHHHLIDEDTGEIHDIPWGAIAVSGAWRVEGFEVSDYQVVMRGRRHRRRGNPGARFTGG
jgi:Fur family iron response transcriptional regulator